MKEPDERKHRRRKLSPWAMLSTTILATLLFVVAAPLVWVALTSVKSEDEIYSQPGQWLPRLPMPAERLRTDGAEIKTPVFMIGSLRVIDRFGEIIEPAADQPISRRWHVETSGVSLSDVIVNGLPFASVDGPFGADGTCQFALRTQLPFPSDRVQAIELAHQPDDSWHVLECRVERQGVSLNALVSARPYPLVGTRVTSRQWRVDDPYDDAPRIRDWISLVPSHAPMKAATLASASERSAEDEINVIFTLRRSSLIDAAILKGRFHYDRVGNAVPLSRYLVTGLSLAIVNAGLLAISSAMAAYAFGALRWRGRDVAFALLVASAIFPPQITLVPRLFLWRQLGGFDTLVPLWLPAAFGNAFFVILLREAVRTMPRNLIDAARIDGCRSWGVFRHVMIPHVAPNLAAVATFAFLSSWNDFLGPLLFISDQRKYPLGFGVYALSVFTGNEPAITSAGAVLATVPPVICFILLHRQVMRLSVASANAQ
jgi:multiple sugar transport system permease protein